MSFTLAEWEWVTHRKPRRGDMDAIAENDTGLYPRGAWETWIDQADRVRLHETTAGTERQQPMPGVDCPSCPCARDRHDGWGCNVCRCVMPIHSLKLTPAWRQP